MLAIKLMILACEYMICKINLIILSKLQSGVLRKKVDLARISE